MNVGGAFEKRWRELGHSRFTLRLKRVAADRLDALCQQHKCNRRDAIEGLLLGSIPVAKVMNEHGLSEFEARVFLGQRVA